MQQIVSSRQSKTSSIVKFVKFVNCDKGCISCNGNIWKSVTRYEIEMMQPCDEHDLSDKFNKFKCAGASLEIMETIETTETSANLSNFADLVRQSLRGRACLAPT
jgi:hypothetical protein